MNESFKINVNKFNSNEKLLALIKIKHPDLEIPLTLVDDNADIIFEEETYLSFPFRLKMNDQVEGQLPQASLIIPNVSGQITKWIDETMGAKDARVEIIITRRSTLTKDYGVNFGVDRVTINNRMITISLSIQNNLIKRAVRWTYDRDHAPGLF